MSRPIHGEELATVARSPDVVWSVVDDFWRDVEWRKGLTDMTPDPRGPPTVGTKVHEMLETGGRSYVADSTVTEVGAMTYRFEGSGTLGKLAGSRTVIAGASPSEALFTYGIEITPSGMTGCCDRSSLARRVAGSGTISSAWAKFSSRAESSRCPGTPR